jgi:signal transduction histidine kinase
VAWLAFASTHEDDPGRTTLIILVVAWSFVGTGLVALAKSPGRFGSLMCAVGLTAFLSALGLANDSIVFTVGLLVGSLWLGVLVHALVAFPTGRLPTRAAVAIVTAAYAAVTLGQLAVLLFDDLAGECPECPDHAVLVAANPTASAIADTVVGTLGAFTTAAVVVYVASRWRAASGPLRRALSPVVWPGTAGVLALAVLYATYALAPGASDVVAWLALVLTAAFPFAFLAGLLRMRLARAAVGRLVIELGGTPPPVGELRDHLSRALRDPELSVAYWRSESSAFVDEDGRPVVLPAPGDRRAVSVIERGGAPVAALIHDASLAQERELVEAVAAAAGLALENERLQTTLRARLEELQASRSRIVEAQASERRRLERNLHDGAQQRLVTLALELRLAESRLEADPERAREMLGRARSELGVAIDELREIARGIHPAVLTDHGLGAALEALAGRASLPVELAELPGERLPEPIEAAAYFVVAEALTNVVKYAHASQATVSVVRRNGHAVVEIADDGVGGADPGRGSGLRGLADRVSALDGSILIESPAGAGTRLRAEIPV